MSNYPVVRNPLLPSPPAPPSQRFRMLQQLSQAPTLKSSMSTLSLKNVVSKSFQHLTQAGHMGRSSPRRIAPHTKTDGGLPQSSSTFSFVSLKKKLPTKSMSTHSVVKKLDPTVHYNGSHHTLEQIPDEKWQWIRQPSLAESQQGLQNPLAHCDTSIMFRKPHRAFTSPMESVMEPRVLKPKAMFYLRVLQITSQTSSKPRVFRCGVQVKQETCVSAYTHTERCGKHSVQANLDETFLFDVDEPCRATLSIFSQQRPGVQLFQSRSNANQQDVCVGQHHFTIDMAPTPKQLQRQVIVDASTGQQYQILVVYGIYVSHRCQNMINQTLLMQDFLTIQVRGTFAPRLERFWVVVRGVQLELYDFDFKESRPPIYMIPLHTLEQAYHGTVDDEHEQPIGSGGLVLQFSEDTLDSQHKNRVIDHAGFECRMFVLAENMARSKEWEHVLNYVVSVFDECRQDGDANSVDSHEYQYVYPAALPEKPRQSSCNIVPAKFLW